MKPHVSLCVFFIILMTRTNALVEEAIDVLKLSKDIIESVFSSWDLVHNLQNKEVLDVEFPIIRRTERKLMSRMAELSRQVDQVDNNIDISATAAISSILKQVNTGTSLEIRLDNLADLVTRLTIASNHMREYVNSFKTLERLTLENYAEWVVSHEPRAVTGLLESVHALMVPTNGGILDRGILGVLAASLKESTEGVCSLRQSPQQVLYQLYSAVSLTELRGYSMIQFSWMLLKLYNKGNFTQEAYLMRKRYEERTAATAEAVRNAMVVASRDVWKCDPSHHKEGETFIALTRLLQGYVENEVNLNNINTCKESCSFYKYTNSSSGCYNGHCSAEQRCNGHLLQCQYIDSDMWVCPSDYKKTDRRYEWIEYENGRTLGQKGACSKGTTKVDSWWRWLFWHCSYCLCVCDEQSPKSDRFFNLRESVSNISSNMVITGLRFVKANRIVHLQIQEGQLMPHGNINTTTTKWRPIDMYKLGDPHVQSGKDYHTLTWSNRSIDLDDLLVPDGHVVTGVRFRMVGTHMNMEVRASPINFTEGIVLEPTHWVSNDNTDASVSLPRTRLSLTQPDIPTRTREPSIIDSKSDQFIEFTHSDIDKDAAQTTVPYLDAQDCSPNPPLPLGGAGLYHKGRNGFGGFVAPKVITYDFSKHVYVEFPLIEDAVN